MRETLKKIPVLVFAVRAGRKIMNALRHSHGGIDEAELRIFNAIKSDIKTVFDVGARLNTDYVDNSPGADIKFYLFEPNPNYFKKLCERVQGRAGKSVEVLNYGLGQKRQRLEYYEDVQSFVKDNGYRKSESKTLLQLEIYTLDEFCKERGIDAVDFLKVDVEGLDYQVLLGGETIIKRSCKYCQFEFGVGQTPDGSINTPEKYYQFFAEEFDLYYVRNPQHPIHKELTNLTELTPLTATFRERIEAFLYRGSGCNILAVRKNYAPPQGFQSLLA